MIARLALVLAVIPLCSYGWVQHRQGVAFASNLPNTDGTACLVMAGSMQWLCRPAVLLPRYAIIAKLEDLPAAPQSNIVGEHPLQRIAFVVPFC